MSIDLLRSALSHFISASSFTILFQAILILAIAYLVFLKRRRPRKAGEYTEREKLRLIDGWKPEPLAPEVPSDHYALNPKIVSSKCGKFIAVDGKKCLNLATHNYLGLNDEKALEEAAIKALKKYGVGTCGPRGFYGTIDIHLKLEGKLANFLQVEEAILYSYGFSAVASAIPAYSKVGDIIFCDEGVHFAIQKGLAASKSKLRFFKHNDIEDLHRLLKEQDDWDNKNPKQAKVIRRFLVVEALYVNYGDICPLKEMIELKKQYKVRLFVDESVSFGVLGNTGRGITEHLNIPIDEIDHISSSLENAISAYGGFCAGTSFIVDHQRLSGLGYCFSASLPSLQAAAAIAALDILKTKPSIVETLRQNCIFAHNELSKISSLIVDGDPISPIKHLRFRKSFENVHVETEQLEEIAEHALDNGFALAVARYLPEEVTFHRPSIRLIINASLDLAEIAQIGGFLGELFDR